MTEYRTNARDAVPEMSLPRLPDAARIRRSARLELAAHLALGAGTLGWLAIIPLARNVFGIGSFEDGAPPREDGVLLALPVLFTTALLTFALVHHVAARSAPVVRTIVLGIALGGANGALFFAARGVLDGHLENCLQMVVVASAFALVVSAPLGLVFGSALAPFVALSSRALVRPSHHAVHAVRTIGATALGLAALVALPLALFAGFTPASAGWLVGALATLALLSALHGALGAQRLRRLRAAVAAGTHPSLVTVALDDAHLDRELAPLDDPGARPEVAVVARHELDAPLLGKPTALALAARQAA